MKVFSGTMNMMAKKKKKNQTVQQQHKPKWLSLGQRVSKIWSSTQWMNMPLVKMSYVFCLGKVYVIFFKWKKQREENYRQQYSPPIPFFVFVFGKKRALYGCMLACSVASVVSESLWPHGLGPTSLLCAWASSGKNTGVLDISFSRESSWPRDQMCVS